MILKFLNYCLAIGKRVRLPKYISRTLFQLNPEHLTNDACKKPFSCKESFIRSVQKSKECGFFCLFFFFFWGGGGIFLWIKNKIN